MSVEAITFVWQTAQVQSTRLLMMLALADFANDVGECWPGIEALAQKVRVKVRNAQTILKKLQESGAIEIEYNNGVTTKTGKTNRYRLVGFIEWFKQIKAIKLGVQNPAPLKTRGASLRRKGVQNPAPDPSLEPSINTTDANASGAPPQEQKSAEASATNTAPADAATSTQEKPQAENSSTTSAKADPPSSELKSPPSSAPPPTSADPTFSAETLHVMAVLLRKDPKIKAHDKAIRTTLGQIRPTGPITPDKLNTFRCNWYKLDFRGKKGQAPEPHQVVDKWAEYTTLACEEGTNHETTSNRNNVPAEPGRPGLLRETGSAAPQADANATGAHGISAEGRRILAESTKRLMDEAIAERSGRKVPGV